jgi:hypothetical protein
MKPKKMSVRLVYIWVQFPSPAPPITYPPLRLALYKVGDQMKNSEVARIFRNISILLDMDDVPFKPRAYEKVALTIEGLEEDVEQTYRNGGLKAL